MEGDYCPRCEGDGTVDGYEQVGQVGPQGVEVRVIKNAVTCPKCHGTGIVTDNE